ncbi:MAG: NADH-quinone oxidoreductase subunit C [Actinomycetota bacterium]
MSATELIAHVKDATAAIDHDEVTPQGQVALHVTPQNWHAVAEHLHDCGRCDFGFMTFITAVDLEEQGFEIVLHVYSASHIQSINVKTVVPREKPVITSVSDLWLGANWHEREMWELFGIDIAGHPSLRKLLLPDQFEGNPLRKEFALITREMKEWPGAKEPGES